MKKSIPVPVIVVTVLAVIAFAMFFLMKGMDRDPSAVLPGDYSKDPTTERNKMLAAKKAEAEKNRNPQ